MYFEEKLKYIETVIEHAASAMHYSSSQIPGGVRVAAHPLPTGSMEKDSASL